MQLLLINLLTEINNKSAFIVRMREFNLFIATAFDSIISNYISFDLSLPQLTIHILYSICVICCLAQPLLLLYGRCCKFCPSLRWKLICKFGVGLYYRRLGWLSRLLLFLVPDFPMNWCSKENFLTCSTSTILCSSCNS